VIAAGAALIWISYVVAVFAGIFGVLLVRPMDWRLHALMVGMMAVPCLLHTLVFAHSRYHLPFIPILLIYATAAILQWRSLWQQRERMLFKVAAVMCVILVAAWIREIVMVDFARLS
jgi:hypothetical protein